MTNKNLKAPNSGKTIALLLAALLAGSSSCVSPKPQQARDPSGPRGCNVEAIWIHTLEHIANVSVADFNACEAVCAKGDVASCAGAALLLQEGWVVEKNETKAQASLEKGCKAKDPTSCSALWMSPLWKLENPAREEAQSAKASLAAACDAGQVRACEALAAYSLRRLERLHEQSERRQVVQHSAVACNLGSQLGCMFLAVMDGNGLGESQNKQKGVDALRKQCSAGFLPACGEVAWIFAHGIAVDKDPNKAAEFYRDTCANGALRACILLGSLLWSNEVSPRPNESAFMLFQKACNGGEPNGCYGVASAYNSGRGVEQNVRRAIEFYELACDRGEPLACHELGLQYEKSIFF